MQSRSQKIQWIALGVCLAVLLGMGAWWLLAKEDFVTLQVKDAELAEVVREMARQTGRTILIAHPSTPQTDGTAASTPLKITAHYEHRPLDDALEEAARQVNHRMAKYYVFASSRESLTALQRDLIRGETAEGWSSLVMVALQARAQLAKRDFGPLLASVRAPIEYTATNRPLAEVLGELSQRSRAIFAADDRVQGSVTIHAQRLSADQVARMIGKQVGARVERFYLLRPNPPGPGRNGRWFAAEDKELEQRIAALPDSLRKPAEQQMAEWRQQVQQWEQMTPLQMSFVASQIFSDPNFKARVIERGTQRLLETTPEERAARDKRRAERMRQGPPR